ncbi:DNA-directed RNA polymerase iii subunit rpc6 [Phtheirospermum japonicum]|uniref:DNA-directed RNA polymerase iii subunit rpc6 n=1 Tax=Phtheirospermum japonicum TaxID=374723 RepID=A0A830BEU9_9LAMI|nr:DNA-directed RNA polymerase iii subunit rpc6 [Phtheirospermum japonicum]
MSRPPVNPSSLKRKRPETQPLGPTGDAESTILRLIKSVGDSGILLKDIKQESKVPDNMCTKVLKSLMGKNLIKEVVNIKNKGRKIYMAVEFEPSKELSGGDWYNNGELDKPFIDSLKKVCFGFIRTQKVSTLDGVYLAVKKSGVVTVEIAKQQIGEIITSLVLDNEILEVKSTGLGDYYSIPMGTTCYRVASGGGAVRGPPTGGFASIPCGACPRIRDCAVDGLISPSTCVYYTKWLDIEF